MSEDQIGYINGVGWICDARCYRYGYEDQFLREERRILKEKTKKTDVDVNRINAINKQLPPTDKGMCYYCSNGYTPYDICYDGC